MNIILAIILGITFGFVLQRVGAADPDKILGMLRLTDMHLAKAILSGIGVSSILLFIGLQIGLIPVAHLSVKSLYSGVLVGGIVFGLGWAISGFCPGTGVAAMGTSRKDSIYFVLGGLAGAAIFMVMYEPLSHSWLYENILGGKVTLAQTAKYEAILGGVNGSIVAVVVGIALILIAYKLPDKMRE
jgi:uncharacterized membrane protein YedE/YeeE